MTSAPKRKRRESLLKVRVHSETKERIISAARSLEMDQSALVRSAILEYLRNHRLDGIQR